MSKDDVEEYIREQLNSPTEITSDDLRPPVCTWCGDELTGEIVTWDIPEHGNESVVYRYKYCSEDCHTNDRQAVMEGGEMHPYGMPEQLSEEEREMLE